MDRNSTQTDSKYRKLQYKDKNVLSFTVIIFYVEVRRGLLYTTMAAKQIRF